MSQPAFTETPETQAANAEILASVPEEDGSIDQLFRDMAVQPADVEEVSADGSEAIETPGTEGTTEATPEPTPREMELQRQVEAERGRREESEHQKELAEEEAAAERQQTFATQQKAVIDQEVSEFAQGMESLGVEARTLAPMLEKYRTSRTREAAIPLLENFYMQKAEAAAELSRDGSISFRELIKLNSRVEMERAVNTASGPNKEISELRDELAAFKKEAAQSKVPAQTYLNSTNGTRGENDLQFLARINALERPLTASEQARSNKLIDG